MGLEKNGKVKRVYITGICDYDIDDACGVNPG